MAKNKDEIETKSHVEKENGVVKLMGHPEAWQPTLATLKRSRDPLQPMEIGVPSRGLVLDFSRQEMRAMRNFINEILDEDEG